MSANRGDFDDEFLTVAEVAGLLKLNQQTVRNWIDQGSMPAVRVGRRVRIRRSDFDRVLADSSSGPPPVASRSTPASAEDFWGGEPVGVPEPAAPPGGSVAVPAPRAPLPHSIKGGGSR